MFVTFSHSKVIVRSNGHLRYSTTHTNLFNTWWYKCLSIVEIVVIQTSIETVPAKLLFEPRSVANFCLCHVMLQPSIWCVTVQEHLSGFNNPYLLGTWYQSFVSYLEQKPFFISLFSVLPFKYFTPPNNNNNNNNNTVIS